MISSSNNQLIPTDGGTRELNSFFIVSFVLLFLDWRNQLQVVERPSPSPSREGQTLVAKLLLGSPTSPSSPHLPTASSHLTSRGDGRVDHRLYMKVGGVTVTSHAAS